VTGNSHRAGRDHFCEVRAQRAQSRPQPAARAPGLASLSQLATTAIARALTLHIVGSFLGKRHHQEIVKVVHNVHSARIVSLAAVSLPIPCPSSRTSSSSNLDDRSFPHTSSEIHLPVHPLARVQQIRVHLEDSFLACPRKHGRVGADSTDEKRAESDPVLEIL
jgi:hypothetical protein